MRVAEIAIRQIGFTQKQLLNGILNRIARNSAGVTDEVSQGKAGAGSVAQAVGVSTLIVAPELDSVVALYPGVVLGPIPSLVGASSDGISLDAANVAAVAQRRHVNVGNAKIGGRKRAGIHAQALGIDLVIDVDDLGKAGVTQAAFQNAIIADVPGPAHARHLGATGRNGVEQIGRVVPARGQAGKWRSALEAVAEDIAN